MAADLVEAGEVDIEPIEAFGVRGQGRKLEAERGWKIAWTDCSMPSRWRSAGARRSISAAVDQTIFA
jgi:hypothetical protein